jgi:hypothetical protein
MRIANYKISILITLSVIMILPVFAHANKYSDTTSLLNDTIHNRSGIHLKMPATHISETENRSDDSVEDALLNSANSYFKSTFTRKELLHFLKSEKLKKEPRDKRIADKLYYRLAKVFVRMKLYPIAMQYYFKTLQKPNEDPVKQYGDTIQDVNNTGETFTGNFLSANYQDIYFQRSENYFTTHHNAENNSEPVSNANIISSFDDGKTAVAYAVIIHVKQPVTGRRKSFTRLNNVGHMFITLIKYNADSTCTSRSFGFYPKKDNLLSATPIRPVTSSVFKDDVLHDWDEAIGKFISRKRFQKVIRLIAHYENRDYNLNNNNCTDFGLYAADVAGITINNTRGNWPLGHGNNPANAGQSMLEGKFINADTGNTHGLFICTDPPDKSLRVVY